MAGSRRVVGALAAALAAARSAAAAEAGSAVGREGPSAACASARREAGCARASSAAAAAVLQEDGGELGAGLGLLQVRASGNDTQQGTRALGAGAAAAAVRPSPASTRLSLAQWAVGAKYQCDTHPTLCGEPFDCWSDPVTKEMSDYWEQVHIATDDGHANLKTWCLDPGFEYSVARYCIVEPDLKRNAQLTYQLMASRGVLENEASYCFIQGHCVNPDVNFNTTLEEAEAICDKHYGHDAWTNIAFGQRPPEVAAQTATGFYDPASGLYWALLGCAMGNYHCDVMYCKETYCKDPKWIAKYGHYLKDYGYVQ